MQIDETTAYSAFGSDVFTDAEMERRLPAEMYRALHRTMEEGTELTIEVAGAVADRDDALALERGATHFTHWFQPMTGATAEKRDTFLTLAGWIARRSSPFPQGAIKGEADGSSFPSGGLRATFEARGYTTWDCTSPAFLKRNGDGSCCLCIPRRFARFRARRSTKRRAAALHGGAQPPGGARAAPAGGRQDAPCDAVRRRGAGIFPRGQARVFAPQGPRVYRATLFGAPPAKGQELSDQYYAATPEPVLAFMHELNDALWRMGVPCKTEHNEVAPSQYELAPCSCPPTWLWITTRSSWNPCAALRNGTGSRACCTKSRLPAVNGSGKHNNWSLLTDTGVNLLKPARTLRRTACFSRS